MKRNKVFLMALSALMLLTCLFAATAQDATISFESDQASYAPGDTFDVRIMLNTGSSNVGVWQVRANFDAAVLDLEVADVTINTAVWSAPSPEAVTIDSGLVKFAGGVFGAGQSGSAILIATLNFEALAEGTPTIAFVGGSDFTNSTMALDATTYTNTLGTLTDLALTIEQGQQWDPINFGFDADAEGWTFSGAVGTFTEPTGEYDAGFLKLQATDNSNTFGFWSSAADAIDMLDNAFLYRARFGVKSDQADKSMVPTFRCRWNLSNKAQGDTLMVNSKMDGEASPDTTVQDYDLYFQPQGDLTGLTGTLALDIINMDSGDAATGAIFADYVQIDRIDKPAAAATPEVSYVFDEDAEGWTTSAAMGAFDLPAFASGTGSLTMTCQDSNNTVGYWQNPQDAIALANDKLYVLKVTAGSNAGAAMEAPLMRIRMYDHPSNQMCYMFQIPILTKYIEGTGGIDTLATSDYYGYFVDSLGVGPNLGIAIDIVNLDAAMDPNGAVVIDAVELSAIDIPSF